MRPEVKKFLSVALNDMVARKVEIKLINKKQIAEDEVKCNGYYLEKPAIFCCAMRKPIKQWLHVFVHEYCHFLQSKEKSALVKKFDRASEKGFWEWLNHEKELDKKAVDYCIEHIKNLECDCENRAVNIIKEFELDSIIPVKQYIRMANSYLFLYNIVKERRSWRKVAPYEIKELLRIMPDDKIHNSPRTPKAIKRAIIKHCF